MPIKVCNSLTKRKEDFVPLNGKKVKMYSCGVTVYDLCHIGHARSLYIFDFIKRYLIWRGYEVEFVRNITDVDDKIINKANELSKSFEAVVSENILAYQKDLRSLGISFADQEPRATENIPEMVSFIDQLIKKDFAYESSGDVYFDVRKFAEYGKLSGQSIDKMLEGVRIDPSERKRDPLDFALWKKSKSGEPAWPSLWAEGRPGWHIECSCMSMKYLKTQTLDIHAGGRDLVFPHHENEIAQSEALTGKSFAKYWIHHGLLTINGQKMAKSLGNFITIQDALKKYNVNVLKFFFLSSHYASAIDFSDEKMEESKRAYERVCILLEKLKRMNLSLVKSASLNSVIDEKRQAFVDSLDDDFNTPKALSVLFDLIHWANRQIENHPSDLNVLTQAKMLLDEMANILGVQFVLITQTEEISLEIKDLLEKRQEARRNKDFKRSDEIRDQLKNLGVSVEDTKEGQVWRKI